jgi:hypothetical protein
MHKILEQALVKKYPDIFKEYGGDIRKTCMGWGMTCGRGWFFLIDELCSKVKDMHVTAKQVKEKFGTLRFYASGDEGCHDVISEYEDKSATTCEECGGPAKTESDHGWLRTICPECDEERKLANKIREGYAYSFDGPDHIIIHDPLEGEEIFSGTVSEFMKLMAPHLRLIEDPTSRSFTPIWEQI